MTPESKDDGISAHALVEPDLSVELKGKRYKVQPVDGFAFQLLKRIEDKSEEEAVETMYKIAFRCLDGALSWEEVFGTETSLGLSPGDVGKIVSEARRQVEAVAVTIPNGSSATDKSVRKTKTQSSPVSRQSMPSAT